MERAICPNCETIRDLHRETRDECIEVRGEQVIVSSSVLRCDFCNIEFDDPSSSVDVLETAYRKFRELKGYMQPEEIKSMRSEYGITQKELSCLLGWGSVTISRYENGALQDEAHNNLLRIVSNNESFADYIERNPLTKENPRFQELLHKLRLNSDELSKNMKRLLNKEAERSVCDVFSGYKKLCLNKLNAMIMMFCLSEPQSKTKLNKLLFYSDFCHYKNHGVGVSGLRYVHLPYGPVPNRFELYFGNLCELENSITIEERCFGEYSGEFIRTTNSIDRSALSRDELKTVNDIWEKLKNMNARQISELSHREVAYSSTREREFISYDYASDISL